ncbi:MAG: long-chain fatty acid--CoA ligase [Desulfobacteraceae bacterium]|nr:long-chain fatty acid--CoA ligase [Desulfobacteraceae bacterium]MBC2757294.1 long-chain fatty acid--CoA ligase [Desulfobacteraceae bacterium]MBC2763913.1 long-chain fatty acid--CoA ligase [ANME-2 cluster archaeon]
MEQTINEVFKNRTEKYKGRLAVEKKLNGKWEKVTWRKYYEHARSVGLGLYSLGIKKGDMVSILSENRLEWIFTDMGTLGLGAVVVPIYTTLTAEEVKYIIENSESKILFVENNMQLEKALSFIDEIESLEKIVVFNKNDAKNSHPAVISFDELISMGKENIEKPALFETLASEVIPEDLATIVYTSGTTGVPKGAMITHKNIMAVIYSLDSIEPKFAYDTDQTVPLLPLSHVFERVAGHFYGMYVGLTASYAESIDTFVVDVKEKCPTVVLAVPRVCEKVYQRILGQVEEQDEWKQKMFHWGYKIGLEISELREKKKPIPLVLGLKYKLAYTLIFKKLADALGGRVRWMTASGAPTSRDIVLFFNASGITVIEGYGMTECCAPATMSNLSDYKIGTVGKPLPNVGIKIADDGEILIKGDNVFAGYWKMEKETQNAFTDDGYLMSGDIGQFDEDGFLMITDRKKDLIITSGGKNIAPQKIEGIFKFDPLFTQFIVVGERKKFLSAMVNINLEQAERIAKQQNITFTKPEDLLDNKDFLKIVDEHVAEKNKQLARYETIKKYRIIKNEFSQEGGELTPSLKMKRNVIYDKYTDLIDTMY